MRFRIAAFLGVSAACALALVAACIPDLITDPADASSSDSGGDGTPPGCGNGRVQPPDEQCDPAGYIDGGVFVGVPTLGCSASCQVECEDGGKVDPRTNHCYFAVEDSTSLNDGVSSAEQTCELYGAHVVTLADDQERAFVVDNFGDQLKVGKLSAFWIGLSLDPARAALVPVSPDTKEPGWSPACSGCYAPPNVDAAIPRLLFDAGGSCVLDVASVGWSQIPCSQLPAPGVPVLCEREPIGDFWYGCNGGFCAVITETAGAKQYLFSFAPATADVARGACADLGGSLAVFGSRQERESLLRSLLHHYDVLRTGDQSIVVPEEAWIGYASDDAGAFAWDGDGGFDGSPWGDTEPTLDASFPARAYVTLDTDNYDVQLAHDDTNVPRPYICQY